LPYLWDTKNIKAKRNTQSADPLSSSASIVREQEVCGLRWDWEIAVPELDTTVFVLPDSETKTRTERVIVLNSIAKRIVERAGPQPTRRATCSASGANGSARCEPPDGAAHGRARVYPEDPMVMKGVHNLRHTCGRRLRAAGVPLETRKQLLGHASGDITTHYSAAELGELLAAARADYESRYWTHPTLTVIRGQRNGCRKCVGNCWRVNSVKCCKSLKIWRARHDSNVRPPGS
jgi:hypothetical protein